MGYYFTGSGLNVSISKYFYTIKPVFMNTEVKFTPSFSRIPIVDGHADLWNIPLTFIFVIGIDILKDKS